MAPSSPHMQDTVDVSTNVYNKIGVGRQIAAVQTLDDVSS